MGSKELISACEDICMRICIFERDSSFDEHRRFFRNVSNVSGVTSDDLFTIYIKHYPQYAASSDDDSPEGHITDFAINYPVYAPKIINAIHCLTASSRRGGGLEEYRESAFAFAYNAFVLPLIFGVPKNLSERELSVYLLTYEILFPFVTNMGISDVMSIFDEMNIDFGVFDKYAQLFKDQEKNDLQYLLGWFIRERKSTTRFITEHYALHGKEPITEQQYRGFYNNDEGKKRHLILLGMVPYFMYASEDVLKKMDDMPTLMTLHCSLLYRIFELRCIHVFHSMSDYRWMVDDIDWLHIEYTESTVSAISQVLDALEDSDNTDSDGIPADDSIEKMFDKALQRHDATFIKVYVIIRSVLLSLKDGNMDFDKISAFFKDISSGLPYDFCIESFLTKNKDKI